MENIFGLIAKMIELTIFFVILYQNFENDTLFAI